MASKFPHYSYFSHFYFIRNKRLLVAYTWAAVINYVQQANREITEQINQDVVISTLSIKAGKLYLSRRNLQKE